MTTAPLWPPPFPFPPAESREWRQEEKTYLAQLLRWRWQQCGAQRELLEEEIAQLIAKLATAKATKRFLKVCEHAQKAHQQALTYLDWLDRVLQGYQAFSAFLAESSPTPEGTVSKFTQHLQAIARQAYVKFYQRPPTPDQINDLASELAVCVIESYFFDAEFDAWLYTTARNILRNMGRNDKKGAISNDPITFETLVNTTEPASIYSSGTVWLQAQIQHDAILQAIRRITNQRYRVILLLLYVYDLSNTELAAFFGVPVSQVNTWKSRARKAFHKHYTSLHTHEGADE